MGRERCQYFGNTAAGLQRSWKPAASITAGILTTASILASSVKYLLQSLLERPLLARLAAPYRSWTRATSLSGLVCPLSGEAARRLKAASFRWRADLRSRSLEKLKRLCAFVINFGVLQQELSMTDVGCKFGCVILLWCHVCFKE